MMMQVVQTLGTINVNTDDISVFCYSKDLTTENFTKVIGRKNKIFSFLEENGIPQGRYSLKPLDQKYHKSHGESIDLKDTHFKTFRLNFGQGNTLRPMLHIRVSFCRENILMQFNSNEKLFIAYMKNYFKQYFEEYDESPYIVSLECQSENTLELLETFVDESERLRYYVDFNISKEEYKNFHQNIHKAENMKWKFSALTKLFNNYFSTLEYTPQNDLSETRQRYLVLVKLYHLDFQQDESAIEGAYCGEQFKKVQVVYDNLKALYENNAW